VIGDGVPQQSLTLLYTLHARTHKHTRNNVNTDEKTERKSQVSREFSIRLPQGLTVLIPYTAKVDVKGKDLSDFCDNNSGVFNIIYFHEILTKVDSYCYTEVSSSSRVQGRLLLVVTTIPSVGHWSAARSANLPGSASGVFCVRVLHDVCHVAKTS